MSFNYYIHQATRMRKAQHEIDHHGSFHAGSAERHRLPPSLKQLQQLFHRQARTCRAGAAQLL
jgi:hypothetical protein